LGDAPPPLQNQEHENQVGTDTIRELQVANTGSGKASQADLDSQPDLQDQAPTPVGSGSRFH